MLSFRSAFALSLTAAFFLLLSGSPAAACGLPAHDGSVTCPNTVATNTASSKSFSAVFVRYAGGGGAPAQYYVSQQSPSPWISAVSGGRDGGSWSTAFTFNFSAGVPITCEATPTVAAGMNGSYGSVTLSQPMASSGTINIGVGWAGAPQSFFPMNGFTIICQQIS